MWPACGLALGLAEEVPVVDVPVPTPVAPVLPVPPVAPVVALPVPPVLPVPPPMSLPAPVLLEPLAAPVEPAPEFIPPPLVPLAAPPPVALPVPPPVCAVAIAVTRQRAPVVRSFFIGVFMVNGLRFQASGVLSVIPLSEASDKNGLVG